MKKLRSIAALMMVPFIWSCTKTNVEAPKFDVSTDKTEYKVGDSITFKINGDPDIITFYSGEKGKEYQYKDRSNVTDGTLGLEIKTQVLYGTQPNNLRLVYSTDFNGTYDTTNVRKATWTDITNRFTLSTAAAGAVGAQVSSGVVNISDIVATNKPMYFAFKYVGDKVPSGTTTTQRTWRIYNFDLNNTLPDGSVLNVASINTGSWLALDFVNTANKWTVQGTAPALFFTPASTLNPSEDWVISKALFPTGVNPDLGTAIKSYIQKLSTYRYAFSKAGTYTVTFVAANGGKSGSESVVKQLTITVK